MRTLVFAAVALHAAAARAGECDRDSAVEMVREFEVYAKQPGSEKPWVSHICFEDQILDSKPLAKRFIAACDTIIAREKTYKDCVRWSSMAGAKQLGGKDIVDLLAAQYPLDSFDYNTAETYERIDDPRVAAMLIVAWKAGLADKRAGKANVADDLARWRHAAARALGAHGGADEKAFLDEQVKTIKDRGVRKECQAASDAIAKRLATP